MQLLLCLLCENATRVLKTQLAESVLPKHNVPELKTLLHRSGNTDSMPLRFELARRVMFNVGVSTLM